MGGTISSETNLAENAHLKRLVGLAPVTDNDPFWNQLFSFNLEIDESDKDASRAFDEAVGDLLQALLYNTTTTGNLAAFIRVFLRRAGELQASEQCENKIFLWQTGNSLLILRVIFKFLAQRLAEPEFVRTFEKTAATTMKTRGDELSDSEEDEESNTEFVSRAEEFLHSLITIVVDLPVSPTTLSIHVEAVKCFVTLLSSQLYLDTVSTKSIFFEYLVQGVCSKRASELTRALLTNYLEHNTEYRKPKRNEPESLVIGAFSSIWSMVQLAAGVDDAQEESPKATPVSLGSLSILLQLVLTCNQNALYPNPFKKSIASFNNAQDVSTLTSDSSIFRIDYNALYSRLCASVEQEPPMLLLYLLLHTNIGFRNYVLSRINLEILVLPVLKVLYTGTQAAAASGNGMTNAHHVYLALIVLLILSEDDFFCKVVHETMVKDIDWWDSERPLGEISLGGLIALVFIRTIQKNTIKTRDRYLHTNCLAALSNMAATFKQLSPVVCQKLIALLELLTKRQVKLVEQMRAHAELDVGGEHNFHEDISAVEEGMRSVLEVTNAALAQGPARNPHLVYSLLYHRELLKQLESHPLLEDLLANLNAVIAHFQQKLAREGNQGGSVSETLAAIERAALQWPSDKMIKFPELKFKYVEDENTLEFFVPYVWRLCVQHSSIQFEAARVKLFNALLL